EDARRVGHQGVAAGAAQVGGGQPFEDLVRDAVGGGDGELERRGVGDAGAVEVGRGLAHLLGQAAELVAGPVNQGHLDAQAAQQGDVEQDVPQVVVGDDGAVEGDDEGL